MDNGLVEHLDIPKKNRFLHIFRIQQLYGKSSHLYSKGSEDTFKTDPSLDAEKSVRLCEGFTGSSKATSM